MNEDEINVISGNNYTEVALILKNFLKINDNVFTFPFLSENNRRVSLWAALFQHLQSKSSESIHILCLTTIRFLSRDKSELENLICEKWIITLIEKAGLFNFVDPQDTMDVDMPLKEVVVEALKCLCNITFNSEVARALCAHTSIAQGLVARLRSYKEIPFKDDIMLYDMKLLFILTALRQDIKAKIKNELHGMDYLISCLNELVLEASEPQCDVAGSREVVEEAHYCFLQHATPTTQEFAQAQHHNICFTPTLEHLQEMLTRQSTMCNRPSSMYNVQHLKMLQCRNEMYVESDSEDLCGVVLCLCKLLDGGCRMLQAKDNTNDNQQAIACEILKTQFNLILQSADVPVSEAEESMYLKLMPALTALLYAQTSTQESLMELHSNIANLLTSVPPVFYQYLTPELNDGETALCTYDGRNMDALHALLQLLQYRLSVTTSTKNQYENLSPVLTVLNKSARGCRAQCKYLRQIVLPPLRDVSRPPEQGHTLRNQLCRLLTTPVTSVRDLVAEFLFILCKERVGRMVKYTGFGNAAGHLAQKGLLGGARGPVHYSSSSEDSDTEEYLQAQPRIDPVVGCTRPPRANPFEGMTDEQKEFEAMKLVNLLDKMMTEGVVRPARVGPDGRPVPLGHVLEMRDHPPNRPQS